MGKTYKNFFEESSKHLSKGAQERADQRAKELIDELIQKEIISIGSIESLDSSDNSKIESNKSESN